MPPSIPTSFVPKQPVEMYPRHSESGGNMFMYVSLVVGAISILLAIGVFAYAHYLSGQASAKEAELQQAQQGVSEDTVEGFVRLRDRLTSAEAILSQHVALSQFFDVFESLTLQNVHFSTLAIVVGKDRSATLKLTGSARSFNALAAQSAAFAAEPRIKQAIFSGISVDKDGTVSFSVTAKIDPKLVQISAAVPSSWVATPPATPAAATTTPDAVPATASTTSPQAASTSSATTTTP